MVALAVGPCEHMTTGCLHGAQHSGKANASQLDSPGTDGPVFGPVVLKDVLLWPIDGFAGFLKL